MVNRRLVALGLLLGLNSLLLLKYFKLLVDICSRIFELYCYCWLSKIDLLFYHNLTVPDCLLRLRGIVEARFKSCS